MIRQVSGTVDVGPWTRAVKWARDRGNGNQRDAASGAQYLPARIRSTKKNPQQVKLVN